MKQAVLFMMIGMFTTASAEAVPLELTDLFVYYDADVSSSHLILSGTSNLHDWEAKSQTMEGYVAFHIDQHVVPKVIQDLVFKQAFTEGRVQIPVKTLKSHSRGLDKRMYVALQAKEHPIITYQLKSMRVLDKTQDEQVTIETNGVVTIAGVDQVMTIPIQLRPLSENRLQVTGNIALKMSDFKIKPPSALLGLIRAGDEITLSWAWLVVRRQGAPWKGGEKDELP